MRRAITITLCEQRRCNVASEDSWETSGQLFLMSHCILSCVAIKVNSPQRSRRVDPFRGPIIKVNRVTGNGSLHVLANERSLSIVDPPDPLRKSLLRLTRVCVVARFIPLLYQGYETPIFQVLSISNSNILRSISKIYRYSISQLFLNWLLL